MNVAFRAGAIIDNYIFFSDNRCNALLSYNINNDQLKYLRDFPCDKVDQNFLHKKCIKYKDKIIYVPNMSEYISIFNPADNSMRNIHVFRADRSRFCFGDAVLSGINLYIIPGNTLQPMLKVNIETGEYVQMCAFYELLNEKPDTLQSFWKVCSYKNRIIIPRFNTNQIVLYDLLTDEFRLMTIGIDKVDSAFCYENIVRLCSVDGRVFTWDVEGNILDEIAVIDNKMDEKIIVFNGEILLVSINGSQIYELQDNRFVNTNKDFPDKCIDLTDHNPYYETFDTWNDNLVLFPNNGGEIIEIGKNRVHRRRVINELDNVYRSRYLMGVKMVSKNTVQKEGSPFCLEDFVCSLNCE